MKKNGPAKGGGHLRSDQYDCGCQRTPTHEQLHSIDSSELYARPSECAGLLYAYVLLEIICNHCKWKNLQLLCVLTKHEK